MHTILLGFLMGAIVASPRLNTFIVPDKTEDCRKVSIAETVYIHLRPELVPVTLAQARCPSCASLPLFGACSGYPATTSVRS